MIRRLAAPAPRDRLPLAVPGPLFQNSVSGKKVIAPAPGGRYNRAAEMGNPKVQAGGRQNVGTRPIKHVHEIRDAIHVFVRISSDERKILDSWPFQRLRYIHQLALTFMVYPGATHRRFEHSLGVMELADRVFGQLTQNPGDFVRGTVDEITHAESLSYWRKVLRVAALCHDLGHLPFSHAAEKALLPKDWNHERLTEQIILSPRMTKILGEMSPAVTPVDVVKLALGPPEGLKLGYSFSVWEALLSEIITSDQFGVDRMDYLLRDSHHAGVVYGHFDHYRVIDTLEFLPRPLEEGEKPEGKEPMLGITEGGIHSADAMLLARFFMFSQLYFHAIRRVYDIHLKDFLVAWLAEKHGGKYPTDVDKHLSITDNEVLAAMLEASTDPALAGHDPARRIVTHQHFQPFYRRIEEDVRINPEAASEVFQAACDEFGKANLRYDRCGTRGGSDLDFPVVRSNGDVVSSLVVSATLPTVPRISSEYVFADRDIVDNAKAWLSEHRHEIIKPVEEDDDSTAKEGES